MDIFELKSAITKFTTVLLYTLDNVEKQRHVNEFLEDAKYYRDKPFLHSGKDPVYGCDSVGYVVYLLRSHGLLDMKNDYTSEMLRCKYPKANMPKPGALVFYGNDGASHVMICLSNRICIGAQGGHAEVTNLTKAREINARIRKLPIRYRTDIIQYSYPFDLIV